jgi:hypothetical protein
VRDARVGGEKLAILGWAHENDPSVWEALFGGVQQHAGDGHIGAQRDSREHEDGPRFDGDGARYADAPVSRRVGAGDGWCEEIDVDFAQRRLEAVGQTFGEYAEERLAAGVLEQFARQFGGRVAGDGARQHIARNLATRSTCQSGSPTSGGWTATPWRGR